MTSCNNIPLRHIATEPASLHHKVMNIEQQQQQGAPPPPPRRNTSKLRLRSSHHLHASDSDLSADTASLSQDSQPDRSPHKLSPGPASSLSSRQMKGLKMDWEILEGLRDGQRCEEKPTRSEGHLMKRRKWPLKGWHKRYFVLDTGILKYAKTQSDMAKGKLHGEVDVGLSVISTKSRGRRIDIDAEEFIYHLKAKSREMFAEWIQHLRHHRLYRQHEIAFGCRDSKLASPADDFVPTLSPVHTLSHNGTPHPVRSPSFLSHNRVAAWLAESSVLDKFNKELTATQESLFHLGSLAKQLDELGSVAGDVSAEVSSSATSIKRDRKRFMLRRKKNKGSVSDLSSLKSHTLDVPSDKRDVRPISMQDSLLKLANVSQSSVSLNIRDLSPLSTSNPNLASLDDSQLADSTLRLNAFPSAHRDQEQKTRNEFLVSAKEIVFNLKSLARTVQTERERLKQALEVENLSLGNNNSSSSAVNSLRTSLAQAVQQNYELRSRLSKIHAESEIGESCISPEPNQASNLQSNVSYESSSVVSISEYFDAAEYIRNADSSSEVSFTDEDDGDSFTSENSETVSDCQNNQISTTGRRTKLPVPKPEGGDFNLWNLLCRNIGKDLSKISMPVTLNEPLNTLQRLCEELEYSDLLDKASETDDPYERMVFVAAYAVSSYSSSYYRASHKPFNPLLGETYECIREDKGFRFIGEQVSHHPPISACHAESKNFILWQDIRIKSTFWGKSMEVQPIGSVHLVLPKHKENYRWNKVTTCIHNLFGGQRWVDSYGELAIVCGAVKCKLTFSKATYWSNKRHEVSGTVVNKEGKVVYNLFGKWNEGLYCGIPPSARCIWRTGAIPEDNDRYYGFTRFAIELNELEPDMVKFLPPTDTRLRPDQRLLEEGNVQSAESVKVQLEQNQRERKKVREDGKDSYEPMWFQKTASNDGWEYNERYWTTRKNPGFINIQYQQQLW